MTSSRLCMISTVDQLGKFVNFCCAASQSEEAALKAAAT